MELLSYILIFIALVIIAFAYGVKNDNISESYIPWAPIDFESKPGPFIKFKISILKKKLSECKAALNNSGTEYTTIEDRKEGECTLSNQISVDQSLYPYSAPVRGQCSLIVTLAMWEKHILKPLAQKYFDSDIARITHYGMFSCRNVSGSSRRSQHASANAIDIAAFQLQNGEKISILKDWPADTAKSKFLKEVHKQSCDLFNGVLGPNYNKLHKDHFHFDLGPYNICR